MATGRMIESDVAAEYRRGEFFVSTDPARLDLDVVHGFLTNCYWAKGIPREVVARSIEHALCFGIYERNGEQVGFARVISDFATIAYVGDVFVIETHRGRGLGKWLMECILQHPALQNLRRWILTTRDAHNLYSQVGFSPVKMPWNDIGPMCIARSRKDHEEFSSIQHDVPPALRIRPADCRCHRQRDAASA